jgi:hypothetical protein
MKRFWGHIWAASFTACIGGVVLPACAHDDSSLYIVQVVYPPKGDLTLGCLYAAPSPTVPGLFNGIIDVGVSSSYSPVVMIGNQLSSRGDQTQTRTETNRIQIRGAVVRVTDSQGNQISTFTSLTNAVIDPEVGSAPGYGLASITIIDPGTSDSVKGSLPNRGARKTLVSYFKVFGQTLGGTYVESGEYQYPLQACNGCLVQFPAESEDPTQPVPNCLAPLSSSASGGGSNAAVPCVMGQDQPLDCRLCQPLDACNPAKLR